MSEERRAEGLINKVAPKEQDKMLLAAAYFWLESETRNQSSFNSGDFLLSHPLRDKLFENLSDNEINNTIHELSYMFRNQEFCAECEGWSHFGIEKSDDFAVGVGADMLWLTGQIKLFRNWEVAKNRAEILEEVLKIKLSEGLRGLLTSRGELVLAG